MKHVNETPERNKHVIEALVRRFGPISQAKIYELTHIRKSGLSQLVREMLEEGRLEEAGLLSTSKGVGRKQVLLRLNEDYRYVAGVEFDEESVIAGVLDLHPRIRHTVTEPTNLSNGMEGLIHQLVSCVKKAARQAGVNSSLLLGIGVADPGLVDSHRGVAVTSSTIEFWKDVPLQALMEREFGVPTLVESKTRARTVAERMLGTGEMPDSMIYVDYGAGIGAGIIADGKLLLGQGGAAGEFGHTHTMEDGPACKCGSLGCLEAVVGARALEARIRVAIASGGNSLALELAKGNPEKITAWDVLTAAEMGDKTCSHIVAELGATLGLGLANVVNLFNPSVVVLDRRLALAGQELLNQILGVVRRQALAYSTANVTIRFARLGPEAGVLGVALLILERHFEIPMLKPPRFMIERVEFPLESSRWKDVAVETMAQEDGTTIEQDERSGTSARL